MMMNSLKPFRNIRMKSTTLFLRLVLGFLCVIALLVSLTAYTLSVSKSNVRHEVVKYNTLMLRSTMENYEKHFAIIKQQMYLFLFSDRVQQLQREPRYSDFPDVISDIRNWVSNSSLYIGNIVFYSKSHGFILEKDTSTTPDNQFGVFMTSESYPKTFWDEQFDAPYSSRILPASSFYSEVFRGRKELVGEYIPVIFKRMDSRDFYMIVFLDARKMYEAFRQPLNEEFAIYDLEGRVVFNRLMTEEAPSLATLMQHGDGEFVRDSTYYFHATGERSGMTYMQRLPVTEMASQTRISLTLIVLVVAVVIVSIVMALLLAARINNPFKRLVESIRGTSEPEPVRFGIREFEVIGSQLREKNKLMKQWAFIHHLKDIRNGDQEAAKLEFAGKPFVFVLFQVVEKQGASWDRESFRSWLYYIKVFIEDKLNRSFPDALTHQIEYNEILSLVFVGAMEELQRLLSEMKTVFDHDADSGTITIAVTSIYDRSDQISEAYREVKERLGERSLVDETQIVASATGRRASLAFAHEEDVQLRANLREGNAEAVKQLLERFFARYGGLEATAAAWRRFAESVAGRIRRAVSETLGEAAAEAILDNAGERIGRCVTVAELERLLQRWGREAANAVLEKRERKDSIVSFVMDYVRKNLAEEIYLDALADKLNLSSGYLSSYFKEKTGVNIVEFVNETRIKKAVDLLVNSRLKIQEVAEAVGYRNITSFNRMFKKYTGLRPSDYRKGGQEQAADG